MVLPTKYTTIPPSGSDRFELAVSRAAGMMRDCYSPTPPVCVHVKIYLDGVPVGKIARYICGNGPVWRLEPGVGFEGVTLESLFDPKATFVMVGSARPVLGPMTDLARLVSLIELCVPTIELTVHAPTFNAPLTIAWVCPV